MYIFDNDKREAVQPPPGMIAWPIEFLLAKHHRKHVFRRRCAPKMSDISIALNSWYNKQMWRYTASQQDDREDNPWRRFRPKPAITPPCPAAVPPSFDQACREIVDGVWHECRRARGRHMGNRGAISNLSGIVSLAMDIFRYGGIGVLPTDKDGGYCLIPKATLVAESLNIVQTTRYREVRNPTDAADEFFDDYALAVKEAGKQLDDLRL
eukprot:8226759-Pyramimonas_sp.AAC.1